MDTLPEKPKLIIVCGPTGVGKTSFSIGLARRFGGEIVGADSVQIYRHMDIGTAKPTAEERARIVHHLVDMIDPDENFDAEQYRDLARRKVAELTDRGVLPFVVGGTGFYIKALTAGLFRTVQADPDVRKRLNEEAEALGSQRLHDRLKKIDPQAAERVHPNDRYRIVRALETYEVTGRCISDYQQEHRFGDTLFHSLKIGLNMDRERLYERINQRVDAMVQEGLLAEVEALVARGFGEKLKSMQSLGYRHMLDYLNGRTDWDSAVELLKRDTRRYAKRQLTWFRADPDIQWFEPKDSDRAKTLIEEFLTENKA